MASLNAEVPVSWRKMRCHQQLLRERGWKEAGGLGGSRGFDRLKRKDRFAFSRKTFKPTKLAMRRARYGLDQDHFYGRS